MSNVIKSDVIIIGGGPTGGVLANLLGQLGVKVVVLEKDLDVYPIPRATHIDEETLRNFQMTGLLPELEKYFEIFGKIDVTDSDGNILLEDSIRQRNSIHGFSSSCFFDQPAFERVLRNGLERFKNVELFLKTEAVSFEEKCDSIIIHTNHALSFQANWVIGCDGGRSVVREWKNIGMDLLAPKREWLIVDVLLKNSADAVLLPDRFRYILDSQRLTIYAYGFGKNRRWEFQLGKNEEVPDDGTIKSWLAKYIELNKLEITRIAKYAHNSLVAQNWFDGKFLLAGDAAHMMPPSAGQGMCSGIRDAINLGWKLCLVINKNADVKLLKSYQTERKPHVTDILKGTLFISNRLNADDKFQHWWRKFQLTAIGKLPPLKAVLRQISLRRNPLKNGFLHEKSKLSGHHFPQFKAIISGTTVYSDDVIGYQSTLFSIPNSLPQNHLEIAKQAGIADFNENSVFNLFQTDIQNWLGENNVDFVIVRPDKIIFGAGKKRLLTQIVEDFQV